MLKMCEETMAKGRILEKLVIILISLLKAPKEMIVPEANLVDDLGADSLGLIKLIMDVEDHFDTDISCEVAEKIKTVGDLVEAIASAKQEAMSQRPAQSSQESDMLSEPMKRQFVSVPG